jgi:hypothetical protein
VLLDLAAVTVEDSVVLDPVEVEGEGLGGLDSDAIYGDTKIPVDVGLATAAGDQPAIPLEGRLDHHGRTPVDRDFRCLNLRAAADHRGELRVRRESVSDPMPDPVGRGARRQDQIDVHRDGGGSGNDGRLRLSEERLCRCGKRRPLDPHEFLPGAIENSDARQRHRLREHADDEKLVFDMVHAIVAANNLGLVYRTDQNRSRPAGLCGRNGRGESEDGHYEMDAHPAGMFPQLMAKPRCWPLQRQQAKNPGTNVFGIKEPLAHRTIPKSSLANIFFVVIAWEIRTTSKYDSTVSGRGRRRGPQISVTR